MFFINYILGRLEEKYKFGSEGFYLERKHKGQGSVCLLFVCWRFH